VRRFRLPPCSVHLADHELIGRFEAIDQAGSLVLRLPDGKTTTVAAADVFMLPAPTSGKAS
jgi:biotin-(acetyl-CoA carboxylase) ligase